MFTVDQIEQAHQNVKSGADFPKYIRDIKQLGVIAFETWVYDSHTQYFGENNYTTQSKPKYDALTISDVSQKDVFAQHLKAHQQGQTDYHAFCTHCAETGIEKWVVDLNALTCTYYDKAQHEILVEPIPQ